MTEIDPANEAARRAIDKDADRWNAIAPRSFHRDAATSLAVDAAREALAPLKVMYEELEPASEGGVVSTVESEFAEGVDYVLRRIRPLIYPSEAAIRL
jgi:hypothetical protein